MLSAAWLFFFKFVSFVCVSLLLIVCLEPFVIVLFLHRYETANYWSSSIILCYSDYHVALYTY